MELPRTVSAEGRALEAAIAASIGAVALVDDPDDDGGLDAEMRAALQMSMQTTGPERMEEALALLRGSTDEGELLVALRYLQKRVRVLQSPSGAYDILLECCKQR